MPFSVGLASHSKMDRRDFVSTVFGDGAGHRKLRRGVLGATASSNSCNDNRLQALCPDGRGW